MRSIFIKLVLSTILQTMVMDVCFGQNISGNFYLEWKDLGQSYYLHLDTSGAFSLFSLQHNPRPESPSYEVLDQMGTGIYQKRDKELTFQFDNNILKYNILTTDSVSCEMSSPHNDGLKTFQINLSFNIPDYKNDYLIIEGYSKEYEYKIADRKQFVVFPDSIPIKNVYISIMTLGRRELPFSNHFNTFRYSYYINDELPQKRIIQNETWHFQIAEQKGDFFGLQNRNSLERLDEKTINYLQSLAAKNSQIRKLIESWFSE